MMAGAGSAQANILALNIDGSTSISSANFALQKQGYINALTALLNTDGSNTIGVWQFASGVQSVFTLTTINSAAAKTALLTAIGAMTQLTGNTAIGNSIDTARIAINGFVGGFGSKIIDVSTDGTNTTGGLPGPATVTANASGITVNCLGVGGSADCSWNGTGLDFVAANTAAFETALRAKLSVELTKTPEPMTLTLFGTGLVGAAFMRRRRAKKA
jgi:hypothetical protein